MTLIATIEPESQEWNARIGYSNLLTETTTSDANGTLRPNTFERYRPAAGTVTIKYQLASLQEINFIGIAAHNFGTHQLGGVPITIAYAVTIGGALIDIDYTQPADNKALFFTFDNISVAEIAITIEAPIVGVEYGVVYAGIYLEMQRPIFGGHSPAALSAKTKYQSTMSESGNFLGLTVTRTGAIGNFSWKNLDHDWYRENFEPFVKSAVTTPWFIQWRPDLYSSEVIYGMKTTDISPTNQGGGTKLMEVGFSMIGHQDV